MQDKLQDTENASEITERRACPRLRPTSLLYIDVGNVNGGIVTSLSENGLAFAAATALGKSELGDAPLQLRIQIPGIPEAIEASGEIVSTSSSRKEARARFVGLEEKVRDQIRSWISAQASRNELRPKPSKLPHMRLPNAKKRKARGARFSFSDVASSPVGAESETKVENLPEISGEPVELPPLQAQGVIFANASEVVASAFENAAFTEDRAEKTHSLPSEQKTQTSPGEILPRQSFLSIPERRQHSRRQVLLFTYAVLGEDNGGLVFNLSEGGLALTAAAPLREDHFNKIRLRFPDSEDWIETSGRLAWKNDSGKEVGIEFVGLPEDARLRIREWVLQEEPAGGFRSEEGEARTSQNPVQELPSFMEPDGPSTYAAETPASFEEQPFEYQAFPEHHFENGAGASAASSSEWFKTGIKGILEGASIKTRVAKIKPPRHPAHSANPSTRAASKALSIAAGVALAVGAWMLFQRSPSNEDSGIIAQNVPNPQPSDETAKRPEIAKTELAAAGPATDPPVHSNENGPTQAGIAKRAVPQIDSAAPNTSRTTASPSANLDRAAKEKPRGKQPIAGVPAANLPRSLEPPQRPAPPQRVQETKSPQLTASVTAPTSKNKLVEDKAAESKPVQVAQAQPTPNSTKYANTAPLTLNAIAPQPVVAPPVDLEKEKPPIAMKQPEAPVARTPVVIVSFDPYPSILMPKTEKPNKSHQGKSLQMGRLLSRVDPDYPEEAKQQGVEGTVRVHAIFNREGAVQNVTSVSGPPMLVPAAMNAVRQWRYSQTILGGQAMETEEDVTLVFRLANSASKN